MGKKQYIAPKIIDLSIETLTGVGAGSCNTGGGVTSSCTTHGTSANTACDLGYGASASCAGGELPFQTGEYCGLGNSAGQCRSGNNATRADGECHSGNTATGVCDPVGGTPNPSNFCLSGPTNANCYSGGAQAPHGSS
ncbi:hypothetical protein [Methanospirillum lacunae]|uniref:hypothetical protein n=1 Tax=Methanospirillum lacunae TaxID=668570 RepID=UPI0011B28446|nr:hypothetical protein [Methanospirillum lacunae]